jgi:hypothetical protein
LSHQFALNLYFLDDSWKDEFRKSTRDIKKHKTFTRVICKGPKLFKIDGLYISNISLKQKTFSALLKGFRLLIKPLHGLHHRQYENGTQSIHRCVSITNASLANKAHLYLLLLCNSRQWNVFNENVTSIACLYFGTRQFTSGQNECQSNQLTDFAAIFSANAFLSDELNAASFCSRRKTVPWFTLRNYTPFVQKETRRTLTWSNNEPTFLAMLSYDDTYQTYCWEIVYSGRTGTPYFAASSCWLTALSTSPVSSLLSPSRIESNLSWYSPLSSSSYGM